ncbi:MAG: cytochrome C peroxidase [Saprospiraceae bacterium]|nr:cytochrome C peroxidase [Saprospiraceae bacterium]
MNIRTLLPVLLLLVLMGCTKDADQPKDDWTYDPTPYLLDYPDAFPIMQVNADNPMTEEGVNLGRRLYYDPLLHPTGQHACATCHIQEMAFTSSGSVLPHINLGWNKSFLWNGKITGTMEDIMRFEVEDFFQADMSRLEADSLYPRLYYEAFGSPHITSTYTAKALAQFFRTLISSNARYDEAFSPGSGEFPTEEEQNGYDIFFTEKGDCFHCHGGILFTDNGFHNNGLDVDPSTEGRSLVTGNPNDLGKFKSPTLRNIALTGPYMHDGRYETLEEVIDFYSEGLKLSPTIDPLMKQAHLGGIHLTTKEKSDLIAFLHTLTDTTFTTNPALGSPF